MSESKSCRHGQRDLANDLAGVATHNGSAYDPTAAIGQVMDLRKTSTVPVDHCSVDLPERHAQRLELEAFRLDLIRVQADVRNFWLSVGWRVGWMSPTRALAAENESILDRDSRLASAAWAKRWAEQRRRRRRCGDLRSATDR